jgi:hypothetical protein
MTNKNIALSIFARAIVDTTFSEYASPYSHTMAFMLLVSAYENYFKIKLFNKDPKLVFKNYKKDNLGNSVNFDEIEIIVREQFNYYLNKDILDKAKKERNKLFHFAEYEISAEFGLRFLFELIIPFIEQEFPNDLEKIFEYMEWYDECVFEGYLIEQLEQYNILYSSLIKRKFECGI